MTWNKSRTKLQSWKWIKFLPNTLTQCTKLLVKLIQGRTRQRILKTISKGIHKNLWMRPLLKLKTKMPSIMPIIKPTRFFNRKPLKLVSKARIKQLWLWIKTGQTVLEDPARSSRMPRNTIMTFSSSWCQLFLQSAKAIGSVKSSSLFRTKRLSDWSPQKSLWPTWFMIRSNHLPINT